MKLTKAMITKGGSYGNLTWYRMWDTWYVRLKSNLTAERVKNDPAFAGFMKNANLLAKASVIASAIYSELPGEKRNRRVCQELVGRVMRVMREEREEKEEKEEIHFFK